MTMHNVPYIVSAPYSMDKRGMPALEVVLYAFYAEHVSTLQLKSLDGPTRARARPLVSLINLAIPFTSDMLRYLVHGRTKNKITTNSFPVARLVISASSCHFSFEPKNFISDSKKEETKSRWVGCCHQWSQFRKKKQNGFPIDEYRQFAFHRHVILITYEYACINEELSPWICRIFLPYKWDPLHRNSHSY